MPRNRHARKDTPNSKSSMSLKLLVDTKSQTVLFAEAGKNFVDFLFSLMLLPVGTVISLFSSSGMVGSIGKVYQSIQKLSHTYIQPSVDKATLLSPKIATYHSICSLVPLLLPNTDELPNTEEVLLEGKKMYTCPRLANSYNTSSPHRFVARDSAATCPHCSTNMTLDVTIVESSDKKGGQDKSSSVSSASSSSEGEGGFVKGVVTYMVMDDLEVTPMSTISSIAMLNKFNVKEVKALEERRVSVGMYEVCIYVYVSVCAHIHKYVLFFLLK